MTKSNFFKIMREYRVTAGASVKQMPALNGVVTVFINQPSAPNAFVARHKVRTGAFELAKLNYTKWLADWFLNLPALVEADHDEALRMDYDFDMKAADEAAARLAARHGVKLSDTVQDIETAHAEARIVDAELDLVACTVLPANRTKYLHNVWAAASTGARAAWLDEAHAEALRMDDVTDLEQMVALMNHEEAHTDAVRTLSHFHGANAAIERTARIEPRKIARERAVFYTLTDPADRQALIERLHEVALEIDYQAFR